MLSNQITPNTSHGSNINTTLLHTWLLLTFHIRTTIKVYLFAVRHLHVSEGYHEHFNLQLTPRLQLVLRGIRKHQSLTLPKRIRLPITIQIMCSINLLKVTIKQSKTDPFHQGVDIYLGATQKPICPISGILPYLAARGNRAGSLFITEDGRALTWQTFSVMLDSVLEKLHLLKASTFIVSRLGQQLLQP